MKALWSEFRNFAFKGNMIDLAVAVVIGGAFGAVVTSMVKNKRSSAQAHGARDPIGVTL